MALSLSSFDLFTLLICTFSNNLCHGAPERLWEEDGEEVEEDGGEDEVDARGEEVEESLGEHWSSRKQNDGHVVKFEEPVRNWEVTCI